METAVFKNFRKALESLMDDEYILIRHLFLKAGEKVEPHYHPKATEWIIINKGIIDVIVNEEYKNFNGSRRLVADEEMVFLFPREKVHSIKAFTDIEYFVLRDKKDKTIAKNTCQ